MARRFRLLTAAVGAARTHIVAASVHLALRRAPRSVAMLPIARELGWAPGVQGIIQVWAPGGSGGCDGTAGWQAGAAGAAAGAPGVLPFTLHSCTPCCVPLLAVDLPVGIPGHAAAGRLSGRPLRR